MKTILFFNQGVGNGSKFSSKNSRWLVRRKGEGWGEKRAQEARWISIGSDRTSRKLFLRARKILDEGGVISAFFQAKTRIKKYPSAVYRVSWMANKRIFGAQKQMNRKGRDFDSIVVCLKQHRFRFSWSKILIFRFSQFLQWNFNDEWEIIKKLWKFS